jgi:hypothetical protein
LCQDGRDKDAAGEQVFSDEDAVRKQESSRRGHRAMITAAGHGLASPSVTIV